MTTISDAEAIAAARAYADDQRNRAWRDGSVRAIRVVVEGIDCWRIIADDAPRPGDTWLDEEIDGGQSYLVDVSTGECVGIGVLNGYRLFRARPGSREKRPTRRSRNPGWRGLFNLLRIGKDDHC